MIVKREPKKIIWLPILIFVIVFYYILRVMTLVDNNGGAFSLEFLTEAINKIYVITTPLSITAKNLGIAAFVGLFSLMCYETIRTQNKKNIQENADGSAEWQDPSVLKSKREKNIEDNIILTQTEQISKNMKKSGMNRHIFIIGRPGSGKSRYFFKPNIANLTSGAIITDPKGELLRDCGYLLRKKHFDIRVLNLDDKSKSNHYNPFFYIRRVRKELTEEEIQNGGVSSSEDVLKEDDIMVLIDVILKNTKSDQIDTQTGDPFWEKAETLYLQSLFYYMMEEYKDRPIYQNFGTVLKLIRLSKPDNQGNLKIDLLFKEFEKKYGSDHIAVKQWNHLQSAMTSPKMFSTIVTCASSRLSPFNIKEVENLVATDDMELNRIGMPFNQDELDEINKNQKKKRKNGKVVYFVITKPSNTTFNFIATIMYTQIFQIVDENSELCGGSLKTPFDMYLDEYAQLGEIPLLLQEIAYVRGLNCGVVISLQSLTQLKMNYKDTWETFLDCVDTILFLGGNSKETLSYFSELIGKKTWYKKSTNRTYSRQGSSGYTWDIHGRELATVDELAKMKKGECLLYLATIGPFFSKLYDLKTHPYYKYLYEPWDKSTIDNMYVHKINEMKTDVDEWKEIIDGLGFEDYEILPTPTIEQVNQTEQKLLEQDGGFLPEEILVSSNKRE